MTALTTPLQLKETQWDLKEKDDTIKKKDAKIKQLRDLNEAMRKGLRTEVQTALHEYGRGGQRGAKAAAVLKIATMEDGSMEEEEEQDPVFRRIVDHFKRDGKGNFKTSIRHFAMELMTDDVSAETAAKRYRSASSSSR